MTTFAGQFSQGFLAGAVPGQVVTRPTRANPTANGLTPVLGFFGTHGALTKHQPTSLLTRPLSGALSHSFLNDLYFRIYLIPPEIDFGFLSLTSTQATVVWNSNFVTETIEAAATTGFDGLSLNIPTLPYALRPLATQTISVTANITGPLTIDASVDLTFSPTTPTPLLPVIGSRAQLWPLSINWADPVTITLAFKTDILKARDETEQRRALRQTPRKTIEFLSTAMDNDDVIGLHQFLGIGQPTSLVVPEPGMNSYLSADAAQADSVFYLASPPTWLLAGLAIRIDVGPTSSVNQVTGVNRTTGAVSLASEIGIAAPAGTRIVAMRLVHLENTLSSDRVLRITSGIRNKYEVFPASEPIYTPPAAPVVYNGYEVFLLKPDWAKPINEQFDWTVEIIDYDWGIQQRFPISPQQTRTLKLTFWDKNATRCLLVADFFYRMRGMQGEFFMPTFDDDLPLRTDILSGQNTIRVVGPSTAVALGYGFSFKFIAIKLLDGTYQYRRIISSSVVTDLIGSDSLLEVDLTLPAIPLATILMVSWMPIWRFATDQLVMEWQSDKVGISSIAIRTRPYNAGSLP
jgi:hypothetical protein